MRTWKTLSIYDHVAGVISGWVAIVTLFMQCIPKSKKVRWSQEPDTWSLDWPWYYSILLTLRYIYFNSVQSVFFNKCCHNVYHMWGSNTSLKHAVFFNKAVLLFIIDSLTINVITPFEMRFEIWLDFSVFLVVVLEIVYSNGCSSGGATMVQWKVKQPLRYPKITRV